MTLTTNHRKALFDALAPLAGEEATEAMLRGYPMCEGDELVTKEVLRSELAEFRTEFKGELAEFRTEFTGEVAALRTEFSNELHDRLRSQTQWMVGTMVAMFGSLVATGGLLVAVTG